MLINRCATQSISCRNAYKCVLELHRRKGGMEIAAKKAAISSCQKAKRVSTHITEKCHAPHMDGTCVRPPTQTHTHIHTRQPPHTHSRVQVDIYRYLLGFSDAETAWRKIQDTAIWRKAKKIDSILSEDLRYAYTGSFGHYSRSL